MRNSASVFRMIVLVFDDQHRTSAASVSWETQEWVGLAGAGVAGVEWALGSKEGCHGTGRDPGIVELWSGRRENNAVLERRSRGRECLSEIRKMSVYSRGRSAPWFLRDAVEAQLGIKGVPHPREETSGERSERAPKRSSSDLRKLR